MWKKKQQKSDPSFLLLTLPGKYPELTLFIPVFLGFLGGSDDKESFCNTGDLGLSLGWEDPLEEGITTHSSILAWRIPWTEEPGGL